MADIAVGDVTYTVTKQRKEDSGNKVNSVTIAFGNSTLTYPSGGIPLTKASMGCPNAIISGHLLQANSGDGIVYKYDQVNNKIRMYRTNAQTHAHDFKVIGGQAAAGTDAISAKTLTLGKEAATDITIAKANSATLGGVMSETLAVGNLIELVGASTAVVAATLYMDVVGW